MAYSDGRCGGEAAAPGREPQVVLNGSCWPRLAGPVAQNAGVLEISGSADADFWPGASLKTVKSYVATKEVNLSVEVDRVSIEQVGTDMAQTTPFWTEALNEILAGGHKLF